MGEGKLKKISSLPMRDVGSRIPSLPSAATLLFFLNDWSLKRLVRAFVLTFCTSNWYNITKLYCDKNSNHLICRLIYFFVVMRHSKLLWLMNIFVDISIISNSERHCVNNKWLLITFNHIFHNCTRLNSGFKKECNEKKLIIVLFLRKHFLVYDVRKVIFQITLLFSIEMSKNRRFQYFVFEFSKNDVASIVSNEYDIFFDKSVQRFDNFEEWFYERSIKITKIYEPFNMFKIDWCVLFYYNFYFCKIDSDFFHRNNCF